MDIPIDRSQILYYISINISKEITNQKMRDTVVKNKVRNI